jgi:hypothetical protein
MQVRQRPEVQLKKFLGWIGVMEFERGIIAVVAAFDALAPHYRDESQLALAAAFLLSLVALMMIVGVAILAATPTELALSAAKHRTTYRAATFRIAVLPYCQHHHHCGHHIHVNWWARWDSNPGPRDSRSPNVSVRRGLSLHLRLGSR